jgi:hypothetical protein
VQQHDNRAVLRSGVGDVEDEVAAPELVDRH